MIIGLTGAMGAGKTTTAGLMKELGWTVFDADAEIHALMTDKAVVALFAEKIPQSVADGVVDRSVLSRLLVEKRLTTAELEALLYPFLRQKAELFIKNHPDGVLDVPLLFEAGWDKLCGKTVYVTAAPEILKRRVFARPNMTDEKYKLLTSRFWAERDKISRADYVIRTENGTEPVKARLMQIKEELCAKSF